MYMLLLIPFLVQAAVISIDEWYFHVKRGLPRWERIGHPLDTLSVIICFFFVLFFPYSSGALKGYIALAVFSCLMVTKDEFVHKHHCPASEQWLHALLFINHPIMLGCLGLIWPVIQNGDSLPWIGHPNELRSFLYVQGAFVVLFFMYQVIFWNFIWKQKKI
jgi:hypothetical protein